MRTTTDVRTALPLDTRSPANLRLRAGDSRLMRLTAGSEVIVTRGELILVEPVRWLGEVGAPALQRLRSGESQRIDAAGWFTLTATSDCELVWVAHCVAAPLASPPAGRVAAWAGSRASAWAQALSNAWRGRHASHTA